MNMPLQKKSRGFSLIELMIAITIGLVLIAAVGAIFFSGSRNYRQDLSRTQMQDELRYGIAALVEDLEMAGFWATLLNPATITLNNSGSSGLAGSDCDAASTAWASATATNLAPVAYADNVTGTSAHAAFPCIASADVLPGTDILAIKRVFGAQAASLQDHQIYLRSNGVNGVLYMQIGTSTPADLTALLPAANNTTWAFSPAIYFIRKYSVTAGDGIPTLCRETLNSANPPSFVSECLASGIENLQLEFGLSTSRNNNYVPDTWVYALTSAQLAQAVAVRIYLLARSTDKVSGYANQKSYQFANLAAYTRFRWHSGPGGVHPNRRWRLELHPSGSSH